jgi:hypothetical protein
MQGMKNNLCVWALRRFLAEGFDSELPEGLWEIFDAEKEFGWAIDAAHEWVASAPREDPTGRWVEGDLAEDEFFPNPFPLGSAWWSLREATKYKGASCDYRKRLEYSHELLVGVDEEQSAKAAFSKVVAQEASERFLLDAARSGLRGRVSGDRVERVVIDMIARSEFEGSPLACLADLRREFAHASHAGSTARALWMKPAFDILKAAGLCYLTFVSQPDRPASFALFSEEKFPGRLGLVWQLSECAMALSVRYDWDLSQATTFLLRGDVPLAHASRISVARAPGQPWPRFHIEADGDLPPAELAQMYLGAREPFLKGFRRLGQKRMALAAVVGVINRADQEAWSKAMEEWNGWAQLHLPEDTKAGYTNLAIFKRDVNKARERMLRPRSGR